MLCHMSSLLDSMERARHAPLLPATTYGVRREGKLWSYPHSRHLHMATSDLDHDFIQIEDVKYVGAIGYIGLRGRGFSLNQRRDM